MMIGDIRHNKTRVAKWFEFLVLIFIDSLICLVKNKKSELLQLGGDPKLYNNK